MKHTSNVSELIRLHLELECVEAEPVSGGFLMRRIECADPDTLYRFYIARHDGGYTRYYSSALPQAIFERLATLPDEQAFHDSEAVLNILALDSPCEEIFRGKSYIFPDGLKPEQYPDVVMQDGRACILQGDRVISGCESSRENDMSAEAWVFTEPDYRGRGYARQVTIAWAHHLQRQGKLPFYSHLQSNTASEALASSLGLVQYITDAGYA